MFEILYTTTDSKEELESLNDEDDILGYIAFYVNGNEYGFYIDNAIEHGLSGGEKITDMFINLTLAYQELNRSGYVIIDDIGSYIAWIEFKRVQDLVSISILRAEKEEGEYCEIRLTPLDKFEYGEWYNETVRLSEMRSELVKKASQYLDELREINVKLLRNKKIAELKALVEEL